MILNKLARYAIIIIIIIVSSVHLPKFYNKIFDKSDGSPHFYYSSIKNDFVYFQFQDSGMKYTDLQDNVYTRKSFEKLLPFTFYRDLINWGVMPDTIQGVAIDASVIHKKSARYRLKAKTLDLKEIKLYPLLESQSDFTNLSFPPEVFRIQDRIEFINGSDNEINLEMTQKFNQVFIENGFKFPAQIIAGNPTTKKPFDEGYLIVDNDGYVFHLKKVKGEPFLVKTTIPNNLNIKKILVQETITKKVYGFLITETSDFYMISYDDYRLIPITLKNYIADQMDLGISVNPLHVLFKYDDNYNFHSCVFDSNYNYIDYTQKSKPFKYQKLTEKVKHMIFPFSIITTNNFSSLQHFSLKLHSMLSIIGILVSLIIGFVVKIKNHENIADNWFDFVIILFTGTYGLIAVLLIKSDSWD